jgi:hypothetical protein
MVGSKGWAMGVLEVGGVVKKEGVEGGGYESV